MRCIGRLHNLGSRGVVETPAQGTICCLSKIHNVSANEQTEEGAQRGEGTFDAPRRKGVRLVTNFSLGFGELFFTGACRRDKTATASARWNEKSYESGLNPQGQM